MWKLANEQKILNALLLDGKFAGSITGVGKFYNYKRDGY